MKPRTGKEDKKMACKSYTESHTARELAITIAQDAHTRHKWAKKLRAELDLCEPVLYRKFVESIERITREMEWCEDFFEECPKCPIQILITQSNPPPASEVKEILEKLKEIKLLSQRHDGTYSLRDVVLERLNTLIQQLEA